MAVPLDAIRAFHNAFRQDVAAMDASACEAARGRDSLSQVLKRFSFFNEVLVWHASGEEEYVFRALESIAPLVSEAYERDHRGLDSLFEMFHGAVAASDMLEAARTTAAFKFHLDLHLEKEEAHLYRIFNERVPIKDQGNIIGKMGQTVPPERFPEVVGWLYPLIGHDDRENMTRIWKQALPEDHFAAAVTLIQTAIGNDWAELIRRIPELKQSMPDPPAI